MTLASTAFVAAAVIGGALFMPACMWVFARLSRNTSSALRDNRSQAIVLGAAAAGSVVAMLVIFGPGLILEALSVGRIRDHQPQYGLIAPGSAAVTAAVLSIGRGFLWLFRASERERNRRA